MEVRRVDPAVRVAEGAVPMVGLRLTEAANGHGQAGHDLIATGHDGRLEDPEQLVGMPVGVATGARKGACGGRRRGLECDAPPFHLRMGGVGEHDGIHHLWL